MSRVKIFTGISSSGWKAINSFYPDCDLLQIERDYPEKINRTFCKCGYVSGKIEEECPICGNKNAEHLTSVNSTRTMIIKEERTLELEYMNNLSGTFEECVSGYRRELSITPNPLNEFEIEETPLEKEFSICSDSVETKSPSFSGFNSYDKEEFKKLYPYELPNIEYYIDDRNRNFCISRVVKYLKDKEENPVLIDNLKKYPNIVNHILNNSTFAKIGKIKDIEQVYSLLNIPDKKLYPYIENLYDGETGNYSYSYRKSGFTDDAFKEYNLLAPELKEIANYILIHGDSGINCFKNICSSLSTIDEENAKTCLIFVRNNYICEGPNIIKTFIKKCDYLTAKGYDINVANLDTRNFNIIKNKEFITEKKKYNEKKSIYFLENFDINPLESLKYLDSRRAPNKDLRKELSDKID